VFVHRQLIESFREDVSMRYRTAVSMLCLLGVSAAVLTASAAQDEKGFVRITPEEVKWQDNPLIKGLQFAIIDGDPSKPGAVYVQRVKFSPGVTSRPHFHPEDRHVLVLKGTWYTGTGDDFDMSKTVPLTAGSYMKHPAKAVHFDGAKDEEVIVQISGIGPGTSIPVKP
jgi:quercetin dioxygenase-like cupin family protein